MSRDSSDCTITKQTIESDNRIIIHNTTLKNGPCSKNNQNSSNTTFTELYIFLSKLRDRIKEIDRIRSQPFWLEPEKKAAPVPAQ